MNPTLQPCVFFDRDGVVNEDPPPGERYVLSLDRFILIPAFVDALRIATDRGYAAVIVTNQLCVEKGLITLAGVEAIHDHLRAKLYASGLVLQGIYACAHGGDHPDRKPNPGMLIRAAREHRLDLGRSWMIGDRPRDMQAGRSAGCVRTVLVGAAPDCPEADVRLAGMDDLPAYLHRELPDVKTANA